MTFLGNRDSGDSAGGDADYGVTNEEIAVSAITVRAPAGHLMCLAHVGTLVSVARISPSVCGSAQGCHGSWYCMTGVKNRKIPTFKN